jgi:hypothetical protein
MRIVYLALICAVIGGVVVATHAFPDKPAASSARTPVLVELYTSEGCSSCPAVDKLVADLQQRQPVANAQVILLSFHVDYWDQLGWHDRFSSHDYTLRQQQYSSMFSEPEVYTPELIVDGKESRPEYLPDEVRNAAMAGGKPVSLHIEPKSARVVTISANSDAKANGRVLVAITEDGLSTKVGGGENGGHTLMHSGVVRKFVSLGKLEKGTFSKDFTLPTDAQWQTQKLMLVCFAQDEKSGRVLGVTAQPLADLLK